MIPNTSYAVSSVQVSQLPIQVSQIEGYHKGASVAWLQFHDSCITPAAGAVPLWEMPVNATAQFQETLQVARANFSEGVFIGLSSTEGTYTASGNTMDITVWTDVTIIPTNVVGDKVSTVSLLSVWTQATGAASAKELYGLIVTEKSGVASFICIYAEDSPASLTPGLCLAQLPLAANTTLKLYFGENKNKSGLPVLWTTALGTTLPRQGCYIYIGYHSAIGSVHYGMPNYLGLPATATSANILAITN